jgi:hypothetical protein
MSYKNLEIWKLAREVVIEIQNFQNSSFLKKVPKYDVHQKVSNQPLLKDMEEEITNKSLSGICFLL